MTLIVQFTGRAERDIASARSWHDQLDVPLGDALLDDIARCYSTAAERPGSFPVLFRNVRRARCERFPYHIYFRVKPPALILLAVYHTARDPERWGEEDRE